MRGVTVHPQHNPLQETVHAEIREATASLDHELQPVHMGVKESFLAKYRLIRCHLHHGTHGRVAYAALRIGESLIDGANGFASENKKVDSVAERRVDNSMMGCGHERNRIKRGRFGQREWKPLSPEQSWFVGWDYEWYIDSNVN